MTSPEGSRLGVLIRQLQGQVTEHDDAIIALATGAAAEPWRNIGAAGEPALQNGYGSGGSPYPQFRKEYGRVWVRGSLSTGTSGMAAFTLPVGYRPAVLIITHNLQANDIAGTFIFVNATGAVVITHTTAAVYLDLSFSTAA